MPLPRGAGHWSELDGLPCERKLLGGRRLTAHHDLLHLPGNPGGRRCSDLCGCSDLPQGALPLGMRRGRAAPQRPRSVVLPIPVVPMLSWAEMSLLRSGEARHSHSRPAPAPSGDLDISQPLFPISRSFSKGERGRTGGRRRRLGMEELGAQLGGACPLAGSVTCQCPPEAAAAACSNKL